MACYIYAGGTPLIRFTPMNGVSVSDTTLGTPIIAVSQGDQLFTYEGTQLTVDSTENTVSVQMSEAETILLVDGIPAYAQLCFYNPETEQTLRFPTHELTVISTLLGTLVTPEEEYDPSEDVDEHGDPYEEEEYDLIDGEIEDIDDYEDYELEDYEEDYADTLEDDPEELYDIDSIEPAGE